MGSALPFTSLVIAFLQIPSTTSSVLSVNSTLKTSRHLVNEEVSTSEPPAQFIEPLKSALLIKKKKKRDLMTVYNTVLGASVASAVKTLIGCPGNALFC